jgi:hypothetical protein
VDCLLAALSAGVFTTAFAEGTPDAKVSIVRVTAITETKKRLIRFDPLAAD